MVGQIFQSAVHIGFIPAGFDDGRLHVIGNQRPGDSAEGAQATHQSVEKILQLLCLDGHRKPIVRIRQTGDKHLAVGEVACVRVCDGQGMTGKVDKELLRRVVGQHHRGVAMVHIPVQMIAKLRVTVPLPMALTVFFP